jgi:hypothetical protein
MRATAMRRLGLTVPAVAALALGVLAGACGRDEEPERDSVTVSIDGAPAVGYVEGRDGVVVSTVLFGSGAMQIQMHGVPGLYVEITLDAVPTGPGTFGGALSLMVDGWTNEADPVSFEITEASPGPGQPIAGMFPTTALTGPTATTASGSFRATRGW